MTTLAIAHAPWHVTDDFPWLSPAAHFPDTRASVLERLRTGTPEVRTEAFGTLVTGYWKPVYKYLRLKWNLDADASADTTQAFLAVAFEKSWFDRFDPSQARFRTFLRVCLDRFVMKERKKEQAERRGGGTTAVALDFPGAEGELGRAGAVTPSDLDAVFHDEFVRALFGRAVADVRAECHRSGKEVPFRLFERYDIEQPEGLTYADLAREFDLPVTQVTSHLAAVRRLFRTRALEQLRVLSGSDEDYRAEALELFGVRVS